MDEYVHLNVLDNFYCSLKTKRQINNISTYITVLVSSVAPSAPILHGGQLYVDVL